MRIKLILLSVLFFCSTLSYGQKYFDFHYTNVPSKALDVYSSSFNMGLGWIYSGKYISAEICKNCNSLSNDSKTKASMIDSLNKAYHQDYPRNVYSKIYVPSGFFHVVESKLKPYMIRTLFEINGNKIKPIYQVKIVFASTMHNGLYNIHDIQVFSPTSMRKFDTKTILANYQKKVKEDKLDIAPPLMERIKD